MMINKTLFLGFLIASFCACKSNSQTVNEEVDSSDVSVATESAPNETKSHNFEITKSDEKWKLELTDFEYYVLREKGTERAFSGDLLKNNKTGTYTCRACDYELFSSETKFKSGTGWPSFYQPIADDKLALDTDNDLGYERNEVMCGRCGGHLGHVFKDGPEPTGLRYCINSVSLNFK